MIRRPTYPEHTMDTLLVRNREAELTAPRLLHGVPYFHLESIFDHIATAKHTGAITTNYLDSGAEGAVFRLQSRTDDRDFAVKLLFQQIRRDPTWEKILAIAPLTTLAKEAITQGLESKPHQPDLTALRAVGGHVLGYHIAKEHVSKPLGVLTLGAGAPVGYMTAMLHGPTVVGRHIKSELPEQLVNHPYLYIDEGGHNAIRTSLEYGQTIIKLIDLKVGENTLNKSPQELTAVSAYND